ncbi:MAG: type II toxin-antitoxin system PemK/MazF family toxin [Gemmatimonadota bacterium]
MTEPSRGEIWQVDLEPVRGHETGKVRPALVVSVDRLNHSKAGLVWIIPITTKDKVIRSHVLVPRGMGGATEDSRVKCEELKSVSIERFRRLRGTVDSKVMQEVVYRLEFFLGLR